MADELQLLRDLFTVDDEPDEHAWELLSQSLSSAIAAEGQNSTRHHTSVRRRRRRAIVAVVAVVVALVATVVVVQHNPSPPTGRTATSPGGPTGFASHWRLTADLMGSQFQVATNAPSAIVGVVCGSGSTCFLSTGYGLDYPGGGGMYVSHDGGRTWVSSPIPSGEAVTTLTSCASNTWCAVGSGLLDAKTGDPLAGKPMRDPELMVTTDGGDSWTSVPVPIPVDVEQIPAEGQFPAETTYWPGGVDAVSCSAPGVCTVLGQAQLNTPAGQISDELLVLRTVDSGATWSKVVLPEELSETADQVVVQPGASESMSCPTPTNCVVVGSLTPGPVSGGSGVVAVWRSSDGGANWTESHVPGAIGIVSQVSCPDPSTCWMISTNSPTDPNGTLLRSDDGGATWLPYTMVNINPKTGATSVDSWDSLSCPNATTCFLGGDGIAETDDAGMSWHKVDLPSQVGAVLQISCLNDGCAAIANPAGSRAAVIGNQGSLVLTDVPTGT